MMSLETIRAALGWCTVINFSILLAWGLGFMLARDWIYRMHSRFFRITKAQFETIQYAGMAFFKISLLIFNLIPYIALRITG